jgi:hypothetical protein
MARMPGRMTCTSLESAIVALCRGDEMLDPLAIHLSQLPPEKCPSWRCSPPITINKMMGSTNTNIRALKRGRPSGG